MPELVRKICRNTNHPYERDVLAKDRNTMAKRQREAEKRDKALRKREKREQRQLQSSQGIEGENRVLKIFRRYLMTTGKMLCLSGPELESNQQSLDKLVADGALVAESFKGGYSLTALGFQRCESLSAASSN